MKKIEKKGILLVDDEREFADAIAERLEFRGFKVKVAYGGRAALDHIAEDPPGLVILDFMMPGQSGLAVFSRIKKIDPELPVVLISGHGSLRFKNEGIGMGAEECLVKPLNIDELVAIINRIQSGVTASVNLRRQNDT